MDRRSMADRRAYAKSQLAEHEALCAHLAAHNKPDCAACGHPYRNHIMAWTRNDGIIIIEGLSQCGDCYHEWERDEFAGEEYEGCKAYEETH